MNFKIFIALIVVLAVSAIRDTIVVRADSMKEPLSNLMSPSVEEVSQNASKRAICAPKDEYEANNNYMQSAKIALAIDSYKINTQTNYLGDMSKSIYATIHKDPWYCFGSVDVDYYAVDIRNQGTLEVKLSSIPMGADYDLYLFHPDHSMAGYSTYLGHTTEKITKAISVYGEYYVVVISPKGDFDNNDKYKLQIINNLKSKTTYQPSVQELINSGFNGAVWTANFINGLDNINIDSYAFDDTNLFYDVLYHNVNNFDISQGFLTSGYYAFNEYYYDKSLINHEALSQVYFLWDKDIKNIIHDYLTIMNDIYKANLGLSPAELAASIAEKLAIEIFISSGMYLFKILFDFTIYEVTIPATLIQIALMLFDQYNITKEVEQAYANGYINASSISEWLNALKNFDHFHNLVTNQVIMLKKYSKLTVNSHTEYTQSGIYNHILTPHFTLYMYSIESRFELQLIADEYFYTSPIIESVHDNLVGMITPIREENGISISFGEFLTNE